MQDHYITDLPIDFNQMYQSARSEDAGAVVIFSGEVRNINNGKSVAKLEYEAYRPMADNGIQKILAEAITKFSLNRAVCIHRIGLLNISECAVVVVTSAPHRDMAYQANIYIIDRVKHEVPIWKKEFYEDGSYEWGNNCNCTTHNHHKHKI